MEYVYTLTQLACVPSDTKRLEISGVRVTDLEFLARLPKLTWLRIDNSDSSIDWSGLRDTPQLETLVLGSRRAPASLTTLDFLTYVPQLDALLLNNAPNLVDLSGVRACPKLTVLHLYHCHQLRQLEPLASLIHLKIVHLVNAPLIEDAQLQWIDQLSPTVLKLQELPRAPQYNGIDYIVRHSSSITPGPRYTRPLLPSLPVYEPRYARPLLPTPPVYEPLFACPFIFCPVEHFPERSRLHKLFSTQETSEPEVSPPADTPPKRHRQTQQPKTPPGRITKRHRSVRRCHTIQQPR